MKTLIAIIIASSFVIFQTGFCYADDVTAVETFAYGDILEYNLAYHHSNKPIKLRCTINKKTGSTHIRYGAENRISWFSTLQPILVKLIGKANALSKGSLSSLVSFEFLNCDDIGKKGVLAFQNHLRWRDYLTESKKRYVKPPNDFVKHTLIQQNVFKDLQDAFRTAGYQIELASIEKVFAVRAEQLSFYADLKIMGIAPDTVFPVPGILGFRLAPKK